MQLQKGNKYQGLSRVKRVIQHNDLKDYDAGNTASSPINYIIYSADVSRIRRV